MKKTLYLKLVQQEGNCRIWNSLLDRYEIYKQKHKILGYLYLPIACVLFGAVAVISLISRISLLFKDIRFTPHYMQTVIRYNDFSDKQANEYLNSQLQDYKRSLSFGNFSAQKRNSIDTTFELLFNEYKLPELEDEKHLAIISNISDVKKLAHENNLEISTLSSSVKESINHIETTTTDKIDNLFIQQTVNFNNTQEQLGHISNNVEGIKSTIEPISLYTKQKQQDEINLEEKRESLKLEQEERSKKARKRENSKNPKHFESSLTDQQLDIFLECCNEIEVFKNPITKQELSDILLCIHKSPLQTTNARLLSLLFSYLQKADYIHSEWQSIAARNICFKSKLGNDMKTNNDFSTAAAASSTVNIEKENIIKQYLKKMEQTENSKK